MSNSPIAKDRSSQPRLGWRCGVVRLSERGYERFEEADLFESLGLYTHPDKTFIGKVARGFDFLGVQFEGDKRLLSEVSQARLSDQLNLKFSSAARLYEQGRLHSLGRLELYLTHWLRWSKGIGIATSSALSAIKQVLEGLRCQRPANVMIPFFTTSLLRWLVQQKQHNKNENIIKKQMGSPTLGGYEHLSVSFH